MGVYLSKANVAMESDSVEGQGMKGVVGDIQGWRRNMEDAHIATTDIRKESGNMDLNADDMSVFGVFDGHGGKEVAKFTQIKFVRELTQTKAFQEGRYRYVAYLLSID
jgi:protein phosphatase 1G